MYDTVLFVISLKYGIVNAYLVILSISFVVAEIFEMINNKEQEDALETILLSWKNKNNISEEKQIDSIIEYFVNKGVFINE